MTRWPHDAVYGNCSPVGCRRLQRLCRRARCVCRIALVMFRLSRFYIRSLDDSRLGLYNSTSFRPASQHRLDAAYCYWRSSVVCLSVCRGHDHELCKSGWTDRVWYADSGGPKEPYISWGPHPHTWRGNFRGKMGWPRTCSNIPVVDILKATQQGAEPVRCGRRLECTRFAPPGECDWTVRVRRRCGLTSNYFDHLFRLCSAYRHFYS